MCSRKCDIPVVPGTSLRPPTWYQTQSETTGACRASMACSTSPLSRRRVRGASNVLGMRSMLTELADAELRADHGARRCARVLRTEQAGFCFIDHRQRDRWIFVRGVADEPGVWRSHAGLGGATFCGDGNGEVAKWK